MTPHKPLLLKDYLELDVDSCDSFLVSSVRSLISTDRHRLTRSKSKVALTKISSIIKLFSSSPAAAPRLLPRSFSRKLSQSFWKKRGVEVQAEDKSLRVRVRDIVRWTSFQEADIAELRRRDRYLTAAPVLSSSSSGSSENGDGESDFHLSSCASSEVSGEHDVGAGEDDGAPLASGGETAISRGESKNDEDKDQKTEFHSEEEKEQLSPVSVMDFPYEEEDEEEDEEEEEDNNSPCFKKTLENIERTRHQLLQKLRRFESLAQLDLDPINLYATFASSDGDQHESPTHVDSDVDDDVDTNSVSSGPAWNLLNQLKADGSCDLQCGGSVEKLLLDLFSEGLSADCSRRTRVSTEEELLKEANGWMCDRGSGDVFGAGQLKEIERSGDWIKFEGGVDEVAADVETGLMRWLLDELVLDLVSC